MSNITEIKNRIESIRDMQKITNAMYLIASAKMRRAKAELNATRPYFTELKTEIKRIFRIEERIENRYFYPITGERELDGAYGYLVITADKGLAGAYNMNVIKKAEELIKEHSPSRLFVVGEYGRHYFSSHHIEFEEDFIYTAQNPTLHRARKISDTLLELYRTGNLKKIFVLYTDFGNGMDTKVIVTRLLPFHRADFISKHRDLMERLKEIGFYYVLVGLEAADDKHLYRYNKKSDLYANSAAAEILNDLGINAMGMFIVDLDFKGRDFRDIAKWVRKHKLKHAAISIFTPEMNSELYDEYIYYQIPDED